MAFQIILYRYSGEANVLNKELYMGSNSNSGRAYMGTLRDGCSILTPTVVIMDSSPEVDDRGVPILDGAPKIVGFNYAYIKQFKRYYFITDIRSVNTMTWEIDMRVDVLRTYKDYIYRMPAFISRCEVKYNRFIKDPLIPFEYERAERTDKYFQSRISVRETDLQEYALPALIVNAANYIGVHDDGKRGESIEGGLINYPSQACSPIGKTLKTYIIAGYELIDKFIEWLQNDSGGSRVATYIASMFLCPFPWRDFLTEFDDYEDIARGPYSEGSSVVFLTIGGSELKVDNINREFQGESYELIGQARFGWNEIIYPDVNSCDFYDYEPYSAYELYIPYYGWYKLNNKMLFRPDGSCKSIAIYHWIDVTNGIDTVNIIYDSNNAGGPESGEESPTYNKNIEYYGETISYSLLCPVPMTATTADAVTRQHQVNSLNYQSQLISGTLNTAVGIGSIIFGAATGNAGMAMGGIGSTIGGIGTIAKGTTGYAGAEAMNVEYGKINPAGSNYGLLHGPDVYIFRKWKQVQAIPAPDMDKFRHLYGTPVSSPVEHLIDAVYEEGNYLKGWKYVKCASVHVEDTEAEGFYATDEEKSEIETLLMNGVQI